MHPLHHLKARIPLWLTLSLVLSGSLMAEAAQGALGDHQWSHGYGNGGRSDVDGLGAIATMGTFNGTVNFGGSDVTAVSNSDVFLTRHDSNGSHLWTQQFTPTTGFASIDELASDESGNIFVTGTLWYGFSPPGPGTIDFGGGAISGMDESFIAGFDANGNHLFSLETGQAKHRGMAAQNGVVAVTGYLYGTTDFGGGSLTSAGQADIFLATLTTSGTHLWSTTYGSTGDQGGMSVSLDNAGNLLLAATSLEAIDFGGGSMTPTAVTGLCLVKLTNTGTHLWSQMFSGDFSSGSGILAEIHVDISENDGRVILAGHLETSCDFGGGTLFGNGNGDLFLAQYDAMGAHMWSNSWGGSKSDYPHGVAFDAADNIFVSGSFFSSNCTFGGDTFTPVAPADFFTALYDPTGAHLWSAQFGIDYGQTTIHPHTDPNGQLVATGYCGSSIDFGGGILSPAALFHVEFEGAVSPPTAVTPWRTDVSLEQNAPNPFNPSTTIRFDLGAAGSAKLQVYDAAGRHVATLAHRSLAAGPHEFTWTGQNDRGRAVASGVYYYRLTAGGVTQSRKMLLAK